MADAPYPYLPVVAMSVPMLANAYALTSLFPYVGWMVVDLGLTDDIDKAGYYAGYIAASFMAGRFMSSYFWGHMSDIYGRKPIIYISCASIAIFSLLFGLSRRFWMAITARFCLGLTNGIVGIAKTVASEISSNKDHEAGAMGLIIGMWSLGFVIGPGLGGLLARPCVSYPSLCGSGDNIFDDFPYLLPNLLPMVLVLIAIPFLFWFLPETLSEEVKQANAGSRLSCFGLCSNNSVGAQGGKQKYAALPMVSLKNTPEDGKEEDVALQEDGEHGFRKSGIQSGKIPIMLGKKSPAYTIIDEDDVEVKWNSIPNGVHEGHDSNDDHDYGEKSDRQQHALQMKASNQLDRIESQGDSDTRTSRVTSTTDGEDDSSHLNHESPHQNVNGGEEEPDTKSMKAPSLCDLLQEQCAMRCIFIYSVYSIASIMFDELLPLWALSSTEKGGLSVETRDIGTFLAVGGACLAIFQATLYSRIANYLGSLTSVRWSAFISIPAYFVIPALSRTSLSLNAIWVWLGVVVIFIRCCNAVAFSCVSILINNSVPRQHRGSLNGLSMTLGSAAKAIGPVLSSILYAWSLHNGLSAPFDYNFVFVCVAILQILTGVLAYKLISPDSFAELQR